MVGHGLGSLLDATGLGAFTQGLVHVHLSTHIRVQCTHAHACWGSGSRASASRKKGLGRVSCGLRLISDIIEVGPPPTNSDHKR